MIAIREAYEVTDANEGWNVDRVIFCSEDCRNEFSAQFVFSTLVPVFDEIESDDLQTCCDWCEESVLLKLVEPDEARKLLASVRW